MVESRIDPSLPVASILDAVGAEVAQLPRRHGLERWVLTRRTPAEPVLLCGHDRCCGGHSASAVHGVGQLDAEVVLHRRSLLLPDVAADRGRLACCPGGEADISAYLGVTVLAADATIAAVLSGFSTTGPRPTLGAELAPLEVTARLLATLLEAQAALARETYRAIVAEWEAHSDGSTGLPNQRGWELKLESEERRCAELGLGAAVAFVDLDGLKAVNDAHGHAHGDLLLWRTAQALRTAVRDRDFVARLGGDEFAVLLPDCDQAGTDAAARRIASALTLADVEASVGTAVRRPGRTLGQTVEAADKAMYEAKSRGRRGGRRCGS